MTWFFIWLSGFVVATAMNLAGFMLEYGNSNFKVKLILSLIFGMFSWIIILQCLLMVIIDKVLKAFNISLRSKPKVEVESM